MINKKQILISLILPITVIIIIPIVLLVFLDQRSLMTLITQILILLILGVFILGIGLLLLIDCIWLFYKVGKGTLAPLSKIETKSMVIKGPYRYVRNPMIIGVLLILLAESFLFNSISILIYTGITFIINAIYMPLSEEKGMIARFGDEYLHYNKNVRAWVPKLHPYSPLDITSAIDFTLTISRRRFTEKIINDLINSLKNTYHIKNPRIKIEEVEPDIDAQLVARTLGYSIEQGRHYRRAGYYTLRKVMETGLARGVEIIISGRITSTRAQKFIFKAGSISNSGVSAQEGVDKGVAKCRLETGMIGVIVRIMRLNYIKGDRIKINHELLTIAQMKQVKKKSKSKLKKRYKIKEKMEFIDDESNDNIDDSE